METENNNGQTPETPSEKPEINRQTKKPKSKTVGRPPREEAEPAKWTIRGVDVETRNLFEKVRSRANKTAGAYFNTEIRAFLTGEIKTGSKPPATAKDMETMLDARLQQLEAKMSPEAFAEAFAKIMEGKTEGDKKGLLARIIDAFKG
jgi:hypothetical protein